MSALKLFLSTSTNSAKGPRYDVRIGSPLGEILIRRSIMPLLDSARALAAMGLTSGEIQLWDAHRPFPRISGKIERLARLAIEETDKRKFGFKPWKPFGVRTGSQKSPFKPRGVPDLPPTARPPTFGLPVRDLEGSMSDALQHQFPVTVFPNKAAITKDERTLSVEGLAEIQRTWRANEKKYLPFIKLATFGDIRTDNNCLRNDKNLLTVTGVEGDYDGEQIDPREASENLKQAGVLATVATSPSHVLLKPRWRVLAPFSRPLEPGQHNRMVDRLNGVLGGVLHPESWTRSQSYYCGSVNGNEDHEVHIVAGDFIDKLDHLDAGAIGKPVEKREKINDHTSSIGLDLHTRHLITEQELREILTAMPNRLADYPDQLCRPAWFNRNTWVTSHMRLPAVLNSRTGRGRCLSNGRHNLMAIEPRLRAYGVASEMSKQVSAPSFAFTRPGMVRGRSGWADRTGSALTVAACMMKFMLRITPHCHVHAATQSNRAGTGGGSALKLHGGRY